jgi:hypothetical protein
MLNKNKKQAILGQGQIGDPAFIAGKSLLLTGGITSGNLRSV